MAKSKYVKLQKMKIGDIDEKRPWLKIIVPLIFIILLYFIGKMIFQQPTDTPPETVANQVYLMRCIDGDTAWFYIDGVETKVRFMAIDTPESIKAVEPYGNEASDYACSLLTNSKTISLEYDPAMENITNEDYTLAWVWADGVLLQETLVRNGYAEVKYIYGDYLYTHQLYEIQDYAKSQKINIWNK